MPGRRIRIDPDEVIDVDSDSDSEEVEPIEEKKEVRGTKRKAPASSGEDNQEHGSPGLSTTHHNGPSGVPAQRSGRFANKDQPQSGSDEDERPFRPYSSSSSNSSLEHPVFGQKETSQPTTRRRWRPISEIPRLSLRTLKGYIRLEGATLITRRSPSPEQGESEDIEDGNTEYEEEREMYDLRSRSHSPVKNGTRTRGGRKVSEEVDDPSSDPLAAGGSSDFEGGTDSDDPLELDGDSEGSDDDEVDAMSRRRSLRGRKGEPLLNKRLTRAQGTTSGLTSRSSAPSSFAEYTFLGKAPKRKPQSRADQSDSSEDFEQEGESEVDSDMEYDELEDSYDEEEEEDLDEYDGTGRGKRGKKGKGKREKVIESESAEEILGKHRAFCEKCSRPPADILLERALASKKRKRSAKRRKKSHDEFEQSDEEIARSLEGWMECENCVTSWHWGCLGFQQKDALALIAKKEGPVGRGGTRRTAVLIDEAETFVCRKCQIVPECYVCLKEELPDKTKAIGAVTKVNKDDGGMEVDGEKDSAVQGTENGQDSESKPVNGGADGGDLDEDALQSHIQFRCIRCKRSAHYEHLKQPLEADDTWDLADKAEYYQQESVKGRDAWFCHQCREWDRTVNLIIAWRPLPADAKEPNTEDYEPHWKDDLPREYLAKFTGQGFRQMTWVPHAWMRAVSPGLLRVFLTKGPVLDLITDETLAARGDDLATPTIANVVDAEGTSVSHQNHAKSDWVGGGPPPDRDAESGVPTAWSTVDRVLDCCLRLPPASRKKEMKAPAKRRPGRPAANRVLSESEEDEGAKESDVQLPELPDGVRPDADDRIEIEEWEKRTGRPLDKTDLESVAGLVTWCFVKWDDLQYDQSTWDTPPPKDSPLYPAFLRALKRYLQARTVEVPILTADQAAERDSVADRPYSPPKSQPKSVVGGILMPFQMEGLQWLLTKYHQRSSAILADDMGLGKTIQIAALLGVIGAKGIFPFLVVVPNSTITNWVREFEKWVPHMRVVPYYGEAASRKIINEYELYRKGQKGRPDGLKAHIVLSTYEFVTGSEFNTFKRIPRWEMVVVDEGQRLKSDDSLIWNNLRKLNSVHRLLLTGTPLNNNIRELFNLLSFLDPDKFNDRHALEVGYKQDDLTDAKIRELHEMVKPYILRRVKGDVLKLPPKVEIIVPISMTPLQKKIYSSIVNRNREFLEQVLANRKKKLAASKAKAEQAAALAAADAALDATEVQNGEGGGKETEGETEKGTEKAAEKENGTEAEQEVEKIPSLEKTEDAEKFSDLGGSAEHKDKEKGEKIDKSHSSGAEDSVGQSGEPLPVVAARAS